jgi:peptidoglycan hydrolase-like protein with peptidoglycan-binding domain
LTWAKQNFKEPSPIAYPDYEDIPTEYRKSVLERTYGMEEARILFESKIGQARERPIGIDVWSTKSKKLSNQLPIFSVYTVSNSVAIAKLRLYRLKFWKIRNFTAFFGKDFRDAIKRFQTSKGIPVTGEIDGNTWTKLGLTLESRVATKVTTKPTTPDISVIAQQLKKQIKISPTAKKTLIPIAVGLAVAVMLDW